MEARPAALKTLADGNMAIWMEQAGENATRRRESVAAVHGSNVVDEHDITHLPLHVDAIFLHDVAHCVERFRRESSAIAEANSLGGIIARVLPSRIGSIELIEPHFLATAFINDNGRKMSGGFEASVGHPFSINAQFHELLFHHRLVAAAVRVLPTTTHG